MTRRLQSVQKDVEERWKTRIEHEDKITMNAVEALRSEMTEVSAKMAEEVVCMKNRHQGITASTVSGSTGSGGNVGTFASRLVQNTFVASRIEHKEWGCWRNIRGTGITMDEAKQLVSKAKARVKQDDLDMFDWDLTDRDQGIFDTKMTVFLWFTEGVTPMVRKQVLNDIQQGLTIQPHEFKNVHVRATLELDPVKRPWKKAQAVFP